MLAARSPAERLGLLLILLSTLSWSSAGLFVRLVPLDPWTQLFWRGLGGAISLFVLILLWERRSPVAAIAGLGRAGVGIAVSSALGMVLYIWSFQFTSVGRIAVIYALTPFLAMAAAYLLYRDRPGPRVLFGAVLALAGIAAMMSDAVDGGTILGDGLMLIVAATMAAVTLIARRVPTVSAMGAAAAGALLSASVAAPLAAPLSATPLEAVTLMVFGIISMGLGLALYTRGATAVPPGQAALITTLELPLSPLWVWLVLGETVSLMTILGGAVVMVAVMMSLTKGEG